MSFSALSMKKTKQLNKIKKDKKHTLKFLRIPYFSSGSAEIIIRKHDRIGLGNHFMRKAPSSGDSWSIESKNIIHFHFS